MTTQTDLFTAVEPKPLSAKAKAMIRFLRDGGWSRTTLAFACCPELAAGYRQRKRELLNAFGENAIICTVHGKGHGVYTVPVEFRERMAAMAMEKEE